MVDLVLFLEPAQDRDCFLHRWLVNEDRLKSPRQRRVFFDVLAVFVERRRADAVQLAASERRLKHVGRIHRAFRLAGTDQGVQLVNEQDHVASSRDLL